MVDYANITVWALQGLLALAFLMAGGGKVIGIKMHVDNFANKWHYPQWMRVVVGLIELTGVGLIVFPSTALYGATLLASIMLGAIHTHFFRERVPKNAIGPVVLLAMAVTVGVLRASEVAWA